MKRDDAGAGEVARWLLFLASKKRRTTPRSNLDLQKHLYYAQGWALARLGRPLFKESIEAWTLGPVVPSVYTRYAQYGREHIPPPAEDECGLDENERSFVAAVWSDYKDYSPNTLVSMTHDEPPWLDARGDLPDDEPSHEVVTRRSMRAHFDSLMPEPLTGEEDQEEEGRRRTG